MLSSISARRAARSTSPVSLSYLLASPFASKYHNHWHCLQKAVLDGGGPQHLSKAKPCDCVCSPECFQGKKCIKSCKSFPVLVFESLPPPSAYPQEVEGPLKYFVKYFGTENWFKNTWLEWGSNPRIRRYSKCSEPRTIRRSFTLESNALDHSAIKPSTKFWSKRYYQPSIIFKVRFTIETEPKSAIFPLIFASDSSEASSLV